MSTHQSLPKPANAKKKSDILPIPAQSKPHPVIAQPKIESTLSNEEQLAQIRANREASERLGSTLLTPESVPHKPPPLQPKLTIGQPGDKYEQEADRVARQVVDQINAPPKIQAKAPRNPMQSVGARKPSPLDDHPVMKVQRQATGGEMEASPDLESSIQRARGGGQPLDDGIRERMEGAFGADFSRVRVHTDGTSDQLNQSIQAKAFTTGQDVFFRSGAYNPGSRGGQELLAHELTHVVQQVGESIQGQVNEATTMNPKTAELDLKHDQISRNIMSIQREVINGHDTQDPVTFNSWIDSITDIDQLNSIYNQLNGIKKKNQHEYNAKEYVLKRLRTVGKLGYLLPEKEFRQKRKAEEQKIDQKRKKISNEQGFPEVEEKTKYHSTQFTDYVINQYHAMMRLAGSNQNEFAPFAAQNTTGGGGFLETYNKALELAQKLDNPNEINFKVENNEIFEHKELADYIDKLWTLYRQKIGDEKNIHQPQIPVWGQLTNWGAGTRVTATFSTVGTFPHGSAAGGTQQELPWLGKFLHKRKVSNGSKTLYVKGHLLNDHVGGPSAAYNLVPLIGKSHYLGSQDANSIHLSIVETQVKNVVDNILALRDSEERLPPSTVERATYQVEAIYGDHQRTNTSFIQTTPSTFINALSEKDRSSLSTKKYLEKMHKDNNPAWNNVADAVFAVASSSKEQEELYPTGTFSRMQSNAKLWDLEDKIVPLALNVKLTVGRLNSKEETVVDTKVPNKLSNELQQRYQED